MSFAGSFTIHLTAQFRQDFQTLSFRAIRKGLSSQLAAAIRNTTEQIASEPEQFGDPLFRYPFLGLVEYRYVEGLVVIHYSVDQTHKCVYLRNTFAFPSRGLESVP